MLTEGNMLPLITKSSQGEYLFVFQDVTGRVYLTHLVFIRGDDLGELTETTWLDKYNSKEGLGNLPGEMIVFNCANDVGLFS